jgi:NAD(P)-dependent dehydrogenase (short-subunit alcohol dehydrogenase family)
MAFTRTLTIPNHMKTLENKVAIVTGSSRGIGAQIAKALSSAGARVVVNYSGNEKAAGQGPASSV